MEHRPAQLVLDRGRRFALTVVNVGLACCAVEAMVASLASASPPGTVPYGDDDRSVDVLVVSGTVTDKLAPLVQRLHAPSAQERIEAGKAIAALPPSGVELYAQRLRRPRTVTAETFRQLILEIWAQVPDPNYARTGNLWMQKPEPPWKPPPWM